MHILFVWFKSSDPSPVFEDITEAWKLQPEEPEHPTKLKFWISVIDDHVRESKAFKSDEQLPNSLLLWHVFKNPMAVLGITPTKLGLGPA